MPTKFLSLSELERRLLQWIGSSLAPRYPFFESNFSHKLASSMGGESIHDLPRWFNNMELASSDCDVPEEQYSEVAIYFLTGELKEVMLERKDLYLKESKKGFWVWEDFKEDLRRLVGKRFFFILYIFLFTGCLLILFFSIFFFILWYFIGEAAKSMSTFQFRVHQIFNFDQ